MGDRQENRWTHMRDEIEDPFRNDFKRGKMTPERKLKMDKQKRQRLMESSWGG